MKPFEVLKVMDRDGNLLEENRAEPTDVIRADTAFVMTNLLRGVVQRGTAAAAANLDWPLAGKTGTVDDNTDAWFIGFDPDITVGVWTGLDEKKIARRGRNRRSGRAADLDGVHEGLHREPAATRITAGVPGARATSCSCPWMRRPARSASPSEPRRDHRNVHRRHAARRTCNTSSRSQSSLIELRRSAAIACCTGLKDLLEIGCAADDLVRDPAGSTRRSRARSPAGS